MRKLGPSTFLLPSAGKVGTFLFFHFRINRYFLNVFGFRVNTGKANRANHREKIVDMYYT